jgi:hypothetical protein
VHSACIKLDDTGTARSTARPAEVMRRQPRALDIARHYHHAIGAGLAWTPRVFETFGPLAGHCLVEDHVIPFRAALLGGLCYVDTPLVLKKPGGLANLDTPAGLYNEYFGTRLRDLDWIVTDYRQFRADLERIEHEGHAELVEVVEHKLALYEFERDLALAGRAGRLALAQRAWRHMRASGNRRFLRLWLIHVLAPLSLWYVGLRRRLRARRRTRSPQPAWRQ